MKVCIKIETEFGWGERRSQVINCVERNSIDVSECESACKIGSGAHLVQLGR